MRCSRGVERAEILGSVFIFVSLLFCCVYFSLVFAHCCSIAHKTSDLFRDRVHTFYIPGWMDPTPAFIYSLHLFYLDANSRRTITHENCARKALSASKGRGTDAVANGACRLFQTRAKLLSINAQCQVKNVWVICSIVKFCLNDRLKTLWAAVHPTKDVFLKKSRQDILLLCDWYHLTPTKGGVRVWRTTLMWYSGLKNLHPL